LIIEAAVQITPWNACIIIKLNSLLDLFTVRTDNSNITLEIVLLYDETSAFAGFAGNGNAVTKPCVSVAITWANADKNSGIAAAQAVCSRFGH
jgi:hypothetical protein